MYGGKNAQAFTYKAIRFFFFSAGDVPVNDSNVVESSQFSSDVLVTQVDIIMFSITFFCFIYNYKYIIFLSGSNLV